MPTETAELRSEIRQIRVSWFCYGSMATTWLFVGVHKLLDWASK